MVNYLQNNCDFGDFSICHSRVGGNPVLNILNLDSHFHGNDNRSLTSFSNNEAGHRQVDGSFHSRFDFGALASRYDSWYETNEGRRHDAAQKQAVLALLPTHPAGGQCLLDVGCGTGHWSLFFAQQGYEVTGVDICPEMIAAAQARKALHCRFAVADAMKLPFLDKGFDVVSAMAMLEFAADARRVCAEMIRCLKPGGCLVLGTLNRLAGVNRRRVAEQAEPYVSARMFAPEELRKLLMVLGNVTLRVTMEGNGQTPDDALTIEHKPAGGNESGAFIVAAVIKP